MTLNVSIELKLCGCYNWMTLIPIAVANSSIISYDSRILGRVSVFSVRYFALMISLSSTYNQIRLTKQHLITKTFFFCITTISVVLLPASNPISHCVNFGYKLKMFIVRLEMNPFVLVSLIVAKIVTIW